MLKIKFKLTRFHKNLEIKPHEYQNSIGMGERTLQRRGLIKIIVDPTNEGALEIVYMQINKLCMYVCMYVCIGMLNERWVAHMN
jgi:hypothetical protein